MMYRHLIVVSLLGMVACETTRHDVTVRGSVSHPTLAQGHPFAVDQVMVYKIREEGLERSELSNTLSYMTDVLGARYTLSNDMRRAQVWVLGEMARIGLENTSLEPFMDFGASWDNEYISLHLLEPDYQPMVGYPLVNTPGTDGEHRLEVVIADGTTREDLERYSGKLRGKAVLSTPPAAIKLSRYSNGVARWTEEKLREMEQPEPPKAPRKRGSPRSTDSVPETERIAFFQEEGVVVVLESRSGWVGAVRGFARPGARRKDGSPVDDLNSIPIVAVNPEHYNRMYRVLERSIPVEIEVEVRNRIGEAIGQASNVLGEIPGTDLADEVVMLGAHLDTWQGCPNASDNTSGVAVMLEAVRILKAIGAQPRRTIRVALWAGEEQGLYGSTAYVRKHFGTPSDPDIGATPEHERFSAYFNQDYGPGQYRGIYLQGNEAARPAMTAWTAPFHDLGMTAVSIRGVGSTDHIPFDDAGLPGFQFLQDRVGGTGGHTNLDYFDTLPLDDLRINAVIVASFVYHAAMSDERIPRKESDRQ